MGYQRRCRTRTSPCHQRNPLACWRAIKAESISTCSYSAPQTSPIALLDQWQTSPHLWLRRTAIIYQLGWKIAADKTLLLALSRREALKHCNIQALSED
ncbi:DNA alkylation repair protein [Deefgea tanakiae]|uniref:DNA alkylation repair protein n=1 Tax=Deefgea tanakiae TaxID=2865840 RepID=A0ABX8ZAU3_9NEIS|nr:DNA alkylation repair protein [Deefgea tanakiae]